MEFTFRLLSWRDVESITTWHYDGPYARYDGKTFASHLRVFLRLRPLFFALTGSEYYAVDDEHGDLVGFFRFSKLPHNIVNIGLGLRPDLTGQGRGLAFVQAGVAFGKYRYAPTSFHLTVASFNQRAMKVYIRAGFWPVRTITRKTPQGVGISWEMRRDV